MIEILGKWSKLCSEFSAEDARLNSGNDPCRKVAHPIKIAKNATRYLTTTSMATFQQRADLF